MLSLKCTASYNLGAIARRFCRILSLILCSTPLWASSTEIPSAERRALIALFASTHGDGWDHTDGWVSSKTGKPGEPGTECDWYGVTCDNEQRHVTGLRLSENQLTGVLPKEIAKLTRLQTVDLSSNRLRGKIPKRLFRLRELETLRLSNNRLSGPLPCMRAMRSTLESLDLSHNYLNGRLDRVSALTHLTRLDLSSNRFEGPIPKSIGRLVLLEELSVQGNYLTGRLPAALGQLTSLKYASFVQNRLSGEIPGELGALHELRVLLLSYNALSGEIPFSFSKLENLETLDGSHNEFGGGFPTRICQDSLSYLNLSWNHFGGGIPSDLHACSEIRNLLLSHNAFEGNLAPTILVSLSKLETLDLSANRLSGPIPKPTGDASLPPLLDLSDNGFTGDLASIDWTETSAVHLDRNHLGGPVPATLLSDSMRELTLSGNDLLGALPKELCDASGLRILDLSHNHLSGPLCDTFANDENLSFLNVSDNQISGNIPPSLFALENLTTIILANNRVTGSLPTMAKSPALQVLDISNNLIVGDLPKWMGELPFLTVLNVKNNLLKGGLERLAKAKALSYGDVSGNEWREPVPQKLVRLHSAADPLRSVAIIDPAFLASLRPQPSPTPTPERTKQPKIVVEALPSGEIESVLTGTVVDPSGGVLAEANVRAMSGDTSRQTTTDGNGHYRLALPAGEYQVTFSKPGFSQEIDKVKIQPNMSNRLNITLTIGLTQETIEVSAPPEGGALQPSWNTWVTRRGAVEDATVTILEVGAQYDFYLELSGTPKKDLERGEVSVPANSGLRRRLTELLSQGRTALLVRMSVLGRAVSVPSGINPVEEWSPSGEWIPIDRPASSAILHVDLRRLLPNLQGVPAPPSPPSSSAVLMSRAAAIRIVIEAKETGCSAIVVSIWDGEELVPLDHLTYIVSVGQQKKCVQNSTDTEASPTLYSPSASRVEPDAALDIFEFSYNGSVHTASFMALRSPIGKCDAYSWDSDVSLTQDILSSNHFKALLSQARSYPDEYANVARLIAGFVFPSKRPGNCGSAEAFEALRMLAQLGEVRMFASISDNNNSLAVVPLGLVSMLLTDSGKSVFEHDIRLFQPLPLETLSDTDCVSSWIFMLPPKLKSVDPKLTTPPDSFNTGDPRVVRDGSTFITKVSEALTEDTPSGVLLVAHYSDGILTWKDDNDSMVYTQFDGHMGDGGIAVLSACETTNLTGNMSLVRRLNKTGVDGLVATAFEFDVRFGTRFAYNFAQQVMNIADQPLTLETAFRAALAQTVTDLSPFVQKNSIRGMGLELVLVGNPKLKICSGNRNPP